ncbi:MAG: MBL fold metallo-hydrolase [Dehalococcoidia bacterium]|nr:MBL fold metallo-hydrolase [Dehalococcoidia bacterium]
MKDSPYNTKDQPAGRAELPQTIQIRPNIYQFTSQKPGSHVYLIKGEVRNVLIDTGITSHFPALQNRLAEIGLGVRDIDLLLLTHEHYDHIGATAYFHKSAVVAAHSLAANKIELQDEFVTFGKFVNEAGGRFWVDIWLEDGTTLDLGKYKLHVIHTPGHTSGCACFYEPKEGLLFSGDTVFAGGVLSTIEVSGNVSDYVNSIERLSQLKIKEIHPGHGRSSNTPDEDLPKAAAYAQALLEDSKTFLEAFLKTRQLHQKGVYWENIEQP